MQIAALLLQRDAALAEAGVSPARRRGCGLRARSRRAPAPAASGRPRRPACPPARCGRRAAGRRTGTRPGVSGTGVTAPSVVAGSAPSAHDQRERLAGVGAGELAEVERAAAVGEPAHDQLALADHLLAVDAQVLAQPRLGHVARAARDDQAPGDQRRDVAGPAGLDRPLRRGRSRRPPGSPPGTAPLRSTAGFMSHSALPIVHSLPASLTDFGGSGSRRLASSWPMPRSSEMSVAPMPSATRWGVPNRLASTGTPYPVGCSNSSAGPPWRSTRSAKRCHFQLRGHRRCYTPELPRSLQIGREIAQITVFHNFWL